MDDWLRVGGENFAVAPIQRALVDHPDVVEAVVLGVPDAVAGDQVLAVLVRQPGSPEGLVDDLMGWMRDQADLPDRWTPRYLRVVDDLPRTGTGKIQRTRLRADAWLADGTLVRDGDSYRPMTGSDRDELQRRFEQAGRAHLLPMAKEHVS